MKKTLAAVFSVFPVYAFAADAAEVHKGWADLDWAGLGWRVFIFVIFAAILYKILKKPLVNMLVKRTADIEKALSDAEKAREAALAQVREYESKMASLERELADMKSNALKAAEKERELILAEAEKTVAKMKRFAVSMIEAETAKAKADLRRELAELASAEAEKRIEKDVRGEKAQDVLDEYIKRIGA